MTEGAGYSALQVLSRHWLTSWLQPCTKQRLDFLGYWHSITAPQACFGVSAHQSARHTLPFILGVLKKNEVVAMSALLRHSDLTHAGLEARKCCFNWNGTHLAWNEVWHWAGCGNLGWEWCCCVGSWSLIVRFPKTVPRLKQFCHEVSKEIWRKSWPPFGSSYCFSFSSPFVLASLEVCLPLPIRGWLWPEVLKAPHVQDKLLQSRCSSLSVAFHPFGHNISYFQWKVATPAIIRRSWAWQCDLWGLWWDWGAELWEWRLHDAWIETLSSGAGDFSLAPELHKLETSNDFVKFASKHGADVTKKGTAYWKVKKGTIWWGFSTGRQTYKKKEVKHVIITVLKAMGIAFGRK